MAEQQLVVLRHGQSIWNVEQRFTGSTNVPLTPEGEQQARRAGQLLRQQGFQFDVVYTSALERSQHTARLALEALGAPDVETIARPALNERRFGVLEGLKFAEAAERYGSQWGEPWLWGLRPDGGESLEDLVERLRPFCDNELLEAVRGGGRALVVAHGNTIRALDYILRGEAAEPFERVPPATPILYRWNGAPAPVSSLLAG